MSSRSKVQGSGFPIFLFPVIGVRRRLISGAVFICVYRRSWRYSHVELGIAQLECLYPTCRSDLGGTGRNGIYPRLDWICLASWAFNVSDFLCVLRVRRGSAFHSSRASRGESAASLSTSRLTPCPTKRRARRSRSRALLPRAPVFRCFLSPAASWLRPRHRPHAPGKGARRTSAGPSCATPT